MVKHDKDTIWAALLHFGMNMWGDIVDKPSRSGMIKKRLTDEEFALVCGDDYLALDRVRFDENLWRELSEQLKKDMPAPAPTA